MIVECKIHGLTDHAKRLNQKGFRCKKCAVDSVRKRRRKVKQLAIEYKGGKCGICGYSKCQAALEFHHLDITIKEFIIAKAYSKSWGRIKKELNKCVLVCSNCHKEIHSGVAQLVDANGC